MRDIVDGGELTNRPQRPPRDIILRLRRGRPELVGARRKHAADVSRMRSSSRRSTCFSLERTEPMPDTLKERVMDELSGDVLASSTVDVPALRVEPAQRSAQTRGRRTVACRSARDRSGGL